MRKSTRIGYAIATGLVLLAVAAVHRVFEESAGPAATVPPAAPPSTETAAEADQGFLYGRITTVLGATYQGRLRWGGHEEAFWDDYFNGFKAENPWAAHVPAELLPRERRAIEVFGLELFARERPAELGRYFMARFGDLVRIEARGVDGVRVTLKSGAVFDLDRFSAGDFDDRVRVWDARRGVVDLDSRRIRAIELLPTARLGSVAERLHGTVRVGNGELTGFLQWGREKGVGSDELHGRTDGGDLGLRFDALRAIARRSGDSAVVTLVDGREMVLSGTRDVGRDHRGIYVDDRRYGRVLVSWDAFERVDFSPGGGSGPAYGDFPPGRPLAGSVTTRGGRRLAGRLVFDLDESQTTETLDAPSAGLDYTIPFGRVASIVLPAPDAPAAPLARVTLDGGEELELERRGDLGPGNAGLLVFADGAQAPAYVQWSEVEVIAFDR